MIPDILNVKIEPFVEEVFEFNYGNPRVRKRRQYLMVTLFTIYFRKLLDDQINLMLPKMELLPYLSREKRGYSVYESNINLDGILEEIGNKLLQVLCTKSSFAMEIIDLSDLEEKCSLKWENVLEMDNDKREQVISENMVGYWNPLQKELYERMPEPVYDCMDFERERRAVYFFSRRLAEYIRFAEENEEIIHNQFQKEHTKIVQAVSTLQHPMQGDWIRVRVSMGTSYVIGFYMGADMENGLSNKDFDWNFFVAVFILEELLDLANSFFHFEESENKNGI